MIYTSESVTPGHPDKVADFISDSILDACLAADSGARVACETLVKGGDVVLAGEISVPGHVLRVAGEPIPVASGDAAATDGARSALDLEPVVREAVRAIGYDDPADPFHAAGVRIRSLLTAQSHQIWKAVGRDAEAANGGEPDLGAGDQGLMFGYATTETPELLPLPPVLAHRLSRALADARRGGRTDLRPDGKTQVSVEYRDGRPVRIATVLVSVQHAPGALDRVRAFLHDDLIPATLGDWLGPDTERVLNPAGEWSDGGPSQDAGLTGRKIIVDTYGGLARHGGGAFSGKDATKVDRSGAYFCRWLARQVVETGIARRAEVQVAYAIGRAEPLSVAVDTFGTGDDDAAADLIRGHDFRPAAIIERFGLRRPIFRRTTNYGHFGRPGLPWEEAVAAAGASVGPRSSSF
jgi:S-adenosylmethionine synthetase